MRISTPGVYVAAEQQGHRLGAGARRHRVLVDAPVDALLNVQLARQGAQLGLVLEHQAHVALGTARGHVVEVVGHDEVAVARGHEGGRLGDERAQRTASSRTIASSARSSTCGVRGGAVVGIVSSSSKNLEPCFYLAIHASRPSHKPPNLPDCAVRSPSS